MSVKIGDQAPSFVLSATDNKTISLDDFRGKNLLIYFYPKDDTPGCTQEAQDFRDLYPEFQKLHTEILGVSKDSLKSHEKFKDKHQLPFQLISDENLEMIEAYGVWVEKSMYGKKYMGIERASFFVDAHGMVQHIWPKVKVKGHAEEVLQFIKKNGF